MSLGVGIQAPLIASTAKMVIPNIFHYEQHSGRYGLNFDEIWSSEIEKSGRYGALE